MSPTVYHPSLLANHQPLFSAGSHLTSGVSWADLQYLGFCLFPFCRCVSRRRQLHSTLPCVVLLFCYVSFLYEVCALQPPAPSFLLSVNTLPLLTACQGICSENTIDGVLESISGGLWRLRGCCSRILAMFKRGDFTALVTPSCSNSSVQTTRISPPNQCKVKLYTEQL